MILLEIHFIMSGIESGLSFKSLRFSSGIQPSSPSGVRTHAPDEATMNKIAEALKKGGAAGVWTTSFGL